MGRYVYDQAWEQERRRLLGMARLWDAGTFALFERLGVAAGWRCLEIGAGAGSVSSWLAKRVGASGRVVAADIDPPYLEPLAGGPLEVARIDVLADGLEQGAFDEDLVDRAIAAFDDPERTFLSPTMIACWGRAQAETYGS